LDDRAGDGMSADALIASITRAAERRVAELRVENDRRVAELIAGRRQAEAEAELWRRGFYSILKELPVDEHDPGNGG
jgi:hypothetical protein